MQNAGLNGNNVVSYIAGAPTRVVGNSLDGFRGVNRRTNGAMHALVEAGLVIPKQVGKEVLFLPFGIAGRILSGTRNAVMGVLRPTAGIAMHAAAQGLQVPLGYDVRNLAPRRLNRIESALNAGQSLGQAVESTRRPGSGTGQEAANPDNQPRP